jgi:hypothetical protein
MTKRMLILVLGLVCAVSAVHAQSRPVQATIPFDFVVGKSVMPAGTYTIAPTGNGGGSAVLLRSKDTKDVMMALPNNYASDTAEHGSELVFKVVGGQYYLWQVWTEGYDHAREFKVRALSTQVADNAAPVQTVSIKTTTPKA